MQLLEPAVACGAPVSHFHRQLPDDASLADTAPSVQYLHQLEDLVEQARTRPTRQHQGRRVRFPNELAEWPCNRCGQHLPEHAFRGRISWCRDCERAFSREYARTLRANAKGLVKKAKWRSKMKGWPFDLDMHDILDMLLEQQGRCSYSSIPMEILHPHSHWRMSLERIDNSGGYIRGNCALIALEFNSSDYSRPFGTRHGDVQGTAQWSAEKVRRVCTPRMLDMGRLHGDISQALAGRTLTQQHPDDSAGMRKEVWSRTLRGKAKILVRNARYRSARKGWPCDVDFIDILRMLLVQEGRCFYSGVPLEYSQCHTDWVMSLERLDNTAGYVNDNCVLIATEFNTTDHSSRAVGEVRGSSQWSLAKVMHVWGHAGCLLPWQACTNSRASKPEGHAASR